MVVFFVVAFSLSANLSFLKDFYLCVWITASWFSVPLAQSQIKQDIRPRSGVWTGCKLKLRWLLWSPLCPLNDASRWCSRSISRLSKGFKRREDECSHHHLSYYPSSIWHKIRPVHTKGILMMCNRYQMDRKRSTYYFGAMIAIQILKESNQLIAYTDIYLWRNCVILTCHSWLCSCLTKPDACQFDIGLVILSRQ